MNKIKLGEILTVKQGYAFKSEYYTSESKYALVTLANISSTNNFQFNREKTTFYGGTFPESFILKEDDLIMPLTEQVVGLFGNTAFVPKMEGTTFVLNQRVGKVVHVNDKTDKNYLHYLLATDLVKDQLEYRASGTRQRNISPDDIYDVEVFLPDINTQRNIGEYLYNIEQKINLNNEINHNLKQQLNTLYDYWFTQYDFPNSNNEPYHQTGGEMNWNDSLKKHIPSGWTVKPLSTLCNILLGGTPSTQKTEYWNGDIYWLNSGEVAQFPVVTSTEKISQEGLNNSSTKLMPKGTTIVSITGNIRASYLAIDTCANQSVVGILGNETMRYPYIHQYLSRLLSKFTAISTGNCQKHINKRTLEDALIVIPDDSVLSKYYNFATPLYENITNNALENQELIRTRDWLLPMLMNGQATISD